MAYRYLRPFPSPLMVGTDIVNISRIRDIITRDKDQRAFKRFVSKALTPREQRTLSIIHGSYATFSQDEVKTRSVSEYLAGRWAAKEAVVKACSHWRSLTFDEIQILPSANRKGVYAAILDSPARAPSDSEAIGASATPSDLVEDLRSYPGEPGGQVARISISHERDYATAVCLAALGPAPGDVGGEAEARTPG